MTAAVNECFTWHKLYRVPAVRFTTSIRAKSSAKEMNVDDMVAAKLISLYGHSAVYLKYCVQNLSQISLSSAGIVLGIFHGAEKKYMNT